MLPLISVIVPIYNVEKYLNQCVDSILMQTMSDFEVILVDDGSTDNSGCICDEYAENNKKVFAFHKENGGLSDARNFGIQKARGEYLLFVDSDDYYDDKDFFEKIKFASLNYNSPEIIGFSYKKYFMSTGKLSMGECIKNVEEANSFENCCDLIKYLIQKKSLIISACAKAIKRSFVINNGLMFKKGIYSEDIEWSMRVFSKTVNMKFIDSAAYIYRNDRIGSITNTISKKNLIDLINIINDYSKKFLESDNPLQKLLINYLAYQYCIVCGLVFRLKTKAERNDIYKFIKDNKWILSYSLSAKVKTVYKLYKLVGIRITVFVLEFYVKHRR